MLKIFLSALLLISCSSAKDEIKNIQESSLSERTVDANSFQNVPGLGIYINIPNNAAINLIKIAKPESELVLLTGAKIKIGATNNTEEFEFIMRKMKSAKNISEYLIDPPARNSLKKIPEECKSKNIFDSEAVRIYSIHGCSFGGFIPVYGIELPTGFIDINVEDNGQEIDFQFLKKIILTIRPLKST